MAYTHVAHDCVVGSKIVMSNCATLGGHVELGDWVIMGGFSGVHQFAKVGMHAFIANNAAVTRDVPPFVMAVGQPAQPHSINSEGLKRRGYTEQQIRNLRNAYRILYRSELRLEDALAQLKEMASHSAGSQSARRFHRDFPAQPGAMTSAPARRRMSAGASPLRVGIVAGEASGDLLGAALISCTARAQARCRVLRRGRPPG